MPAYCLTTLLITWLLLAFVYVLQLSSIPKIPDPKVMMERMDDMSRKLLSARNETMILKENAQEALVEKQIAVLVLACNRPDALRNHLELLTRYRPFEYHFPIIVSQDCNDPNTASVVQTYEHQVTLITHPHQKPIVMPAGSPFKYLGYYKISRHYRWALNYTFNELGYRTLVVTEDDLEIAVDFFEYFAATKELLHKDPTLWCVSGWNDNGKDQLIDSAQTQLLYRTDFFPGLGWMLTREIFNELLPKWPAAFWDDWMRRPDVRKNRSCIRPEISRTAMSTFGRTGVSLGTFFDQYLKFVKINRKFEPFQSMDLSYLLKNNYDRSFNKIVFDTPLTSAEKVKNSEIARLPRTARITYSDPQSYHKVAKSFDLMEDFRSGVPRTAYQGIVTFYYKNTRVYLTLDRVWNSYDPNWH